MDILAKNLADSVVELRRKHGLSQMQLAKKAGLPRSTLTYIESGTSNPSLTSLAKLSNALQVSVEELISRPKAYVQLIKSADIAVQWKSKKQVRVEKLLPDPIPGMEIDRMALAPGSRLKGTPHIARTKEYLYCTSGSILVYVNKAQYILEEGDVITFPGDEPHTYANQSHSKKAVGFSVVVFAPSGIY